MKNILSFKPGTKILGRDILDWANFQVKHHTSHYKHGKRILHCFSNIRPDQMYFVKTQYETGGCGEIRHEPQVIRAI